MQNKGFIRVIAVLLTLICLFYLSFSVVTKVYDDKAKEYAAGDSAKYRDYIDSISTEKVYLGYYTYQKCREMGIGLGLDLKGGMSVTLQISVADVLKSLSNNNADPAFNQALVEAEKGGDDFLDAFYDAYRDQPNHGNLAEIFSNYEMRDKIKESASDDEVLKVLRDELNSAIDNSYNVLRNRIDRFGVTNPNIQKLEKDGRIMVELPGVEDEERVRKLLQGSANLEFWATYFLGEVYGALEQVNAFTLAPKNLADTTQTDTTGVASETPVQVGKGLFDMINVDSLRPETPVIALVHKRDTSDVNKILSNPEVRNNILPQDLELRWSVNPRGESQNYELYALKGTKDGGPALGGDVITDAKDDFDQLRGSMVNMAMNGEGSKEWAKITRENKDRAIAIVLDGQVYSSPNVNDEITGGRSEITGHFTPEEAKDLANVLKSGKMAAAVNIVEFNNIGPSLGEEAIESGMISFLVALVLLMLYLIIMYGWTPGLIAGFGILCNLFFTMGILASLQAVLTLSGIAGIVLSLAMAVDANVLIFERTKEELRSGKGIKTAVADGYKNAFSAIFDSNLTSIITGVVLLIYGTGPILGFATTLIIGIATSFFTAIFITRLVFEAGLNRGKFSKMTFSTPISRNFLTDMHINFVGLRKKGYIILSVVVVAVVASFVLRGLQQGIDFSGGRNYMIKVYAKSTEAEAMLKPSFEGSSLSVITVKGKEQDYLRVSTNYGIDREGDEVDLEIEEKLYTGMKSLLGEDVTFDDFRNEIIMSKQKVGPTIADDIKTGAYWAVFWALIAMALYILIRFRNIAFSVGTLASVAFTAFSVVGLYSLLYGILPFSMEIDQNFIAAVLTVIGYSVNDTVVIFDRIREERTLYPKRDLTTTINSALNSTLPRTINTGQSTIIVLLCILLLGAESTRSFAFAMLFGVIIGTFATLFVATPIAYEIQNRRQAKKLAKESAAAAVAKK